MRTLVVLALLCGAGSASAQVISSSNLGCTVVAPSGMSCNGIGIPETKSAGKHTPKLYITNFVLEPGAVLEQPSSSSDCMLVGINGGDLVNEKTPFLHVSLEHDSVTLMPKEQPFRLRNKGSDKVEFRMIEIRR